MNDFNPKLFAERMGIKIPVGDQEELPANPVPSLTELRNGVATAISNQKLFEDRGQPLEPSHDNLNESDIADKNSTQETFRQLEIDKMVDLLKANYKPMLTLDLPQEELATELEYMKNLKPTELVKRLEDIFQATNTLTQKVARDEAYVDLHLAQLNIPVNDTNRRLVAEAFPTFYKDSIMNRALLLAAKKAESGTEEFTDDEIRSLVNLRPSSKVESGKMHPSQISTTMVSGSNSPYPEEM